MSVDERMQIVEDARWSSRDVRNTAASVVLRLFGLDIGNTKHAEPASGVRGILVFTGQQISRLIVLAGRAMGSMLKGFFSLFFSAMNIGEAVTNWIAKLLVRAGADPYKPYLSANGVAAARRYLGTKIKLRSENMPDVADLITDFPVLRMRLIHQSPDTASEVDRLNAEADFRLAIVLPLLAISLIFAFEVSFFFLFLCPPLLALRITARQKHYEAGELMIDALNQDVIQAPTVESYLSSPCNKQGMSLADHTSS
jgi:hypothetical protein